MSDETSEDEQPTPLTPRPRFLARTGRHGNYKKLPPTTPTDLGRWVYVEDPNERDDDHGYTSTGFQAVQSEPECVGPAILENYAQVNRRILTQHLVLEVAEAQERRPELTPQNRLDTVRQRAKHAHVDMSHPIHLVQIELDKARMREKAVKPSVLVRLEGLEALLDGVSILRLAA